MRLFIFTIFLVPGLAYSQSCSELESDLLNIEYDLMRSKMNQCEEGQSRSHCRDGNMNDQTYFEVLQDYNKAMANLVIHNGIEAITATISGSHNSIADLDDTEIDEASSYLKTLEENIDKANVLEAAMTPVAGSDGFLTSFWNKYSYDFSVVGGPSDDVAFEDKFRKDCSNNPEEALCSAVFSLDNVFKPGNHVFDTLKGYAIAEQSARTTSGNPESFYNEHKPKLQVTVLSREDDGNITEEVISAIEYRTRFFGPTGTMSKLKRDLESYKENKDNEDLKRSIVANVVALDGVSTTYGIPTSGASDGEKRINEELTLTFEKAKIDLNSDITSKLTSDLWKTNLTNNIDRIVADKDVYSKGLDQRIMKFVDEFAPNRCESNESPKDCLRSICGLTETKTVCQDGELVKLMESPLTEELQRFNQYGDFETKFASAIECFDKPTLRAKESCLKEVRAAINPSIETNKDKLRDNLREAREKLDKYNSAQPFVGLTERKVLAIAALANNSCIDNEDTSRISCSQTIDDSVADYGALDLATDLGNISVRLTRSMFNDVGSNGQRSGILKEDFDQYASDLERDCENDGTRSKYSGLCTYNFEKLDPEYRAVRDVSTSRRNEFDRTVRRSRAIAYQEVNWDSNDKSNGSIIGAGIMQGLMQPNPITGQTSLGTLVSGTAGYFQTKSDMKNMSRRIAAQESLFEARQNYLESIRPNLYSDAQYLPYNGGYIHNGYVYDKNFQAQAAGGYLYAPTSNPLSYNFQTSLPVGTPGNSGGITPVPTTSPSPAGIAPPPSSVPGSIPFNFSI